MSEQSPEPNESGRVESDPIELSHGAIIGSGQSIGLEPSDAFVAPTMALDSFDPETDD